jgi:hypothetical protein
MPIIKNRIRGFLSESIHLNEFSHTILHKQKIVDPNMKFDEITQVLKEEPIPLDMLRLQMMKEKKEKDAQEKSEKDKIEKMEKHRLEREKIEREKMEQEKREREKLEQELKNKEKESRLQKLKNMMQLPPEKERDRSPLLRNAITPNNNPKPLQKLEMPNSPFTPGLLVRNKEFEQPRTPNYPSRNDVFNPFLKNNDRSDIKKVEIKPILYAAPNKEPQSVRGEKSPLIDNKRALIIKDTPSNKSSDDGKPSDLRIEGTKIGEEKPSVSPRNVFAHNNLRDAAQLDKLKDKAKENEEKNRKIAEVLKEGKKKRDQYKNQLEALKREDEQKKNEFEHLLFEKKKERDDDRKKMLDDIDRKRVINHVFLFLSQ